MDKRESRLIVDSEGTLMWLMFSQTYMVVTGVEILNRNTVLTNTESYLYVSFT